MTLKLLRISVFLFIYLSFKSANPVPLLFALILFYLWQYRDLTGFLMVFFLLLTPSTPSLYSSDIGSVVKLSQHTATISHKNEYLVVKGELSGLNFGDVIYINETIKPIQSSLNNHGFNYSQSLFDQNIFSEVYLNKLIIIEKGTSLKAKLYHYVTHLEDSALKSLYLRFLFNIKTEDTQDLFMEIGLPYYGLIMVLNLILKTKFSYQKRLIAQASILCIILLILGSSFSLVRLLLGLLLSLITKNKQLRLALWSLSLMILYPTMIHHVAFIFPLSFRYLNTFNPSYKRSYAYLMSALIQGYYFLRVNLLVLFCYRYLCLWYGAIYLYLLVSLIYPSFFIQGGQIILDLQSMIQLAGLYILGKPNLWTLLFLMVAYSFRVKPYVILGLYLVLLYFNLFQLNYEVIFINVNQGDSVLITSPFNQEVILYDTGKLSQYQRVKNYLWAKGINKIDYLILSHQDEDHTGGLVPLLEDFKVDTIIEEDIDFKALNTTFYSLNKGARGTSNDDSLVYYFNIYDMTFLLTGDISKTVEKRLIKEYNLASHILKIGHHGSQTSTSLTFLESTNPLLAIISTSGQYQHPHAIVIENLKKANIEYRVTKESGDIRFIITNFINFMHTSNQEFGIIK